jgi:hypothetical protein
MKFEIDKKENKFILTVDDVVVFESDKLSDIVRKVEAYTKLRFLPEPVKLSLIERFKGVVDGRR